MNCTNLENIIKELADDCHEMIQEIKLRSGAQKSLKILFKNTFLTDTLLFLARFWRFSAHFGAFEEAVAVFDGVPPV